MPIRLYNMFPFSGESLVKSYRLVFAQQSKTNESRRVFVLALIVRAPATPFCEFFSFLGFEIDELVYRIECVGWTRVAPRNLRNHTPPKAGSKASRYTYLHVGTL